MVEKIPQSGSIITNEELFADMTSLLHTFTIFNSSLRTVGDEMIQKFKNDPYGGSFKNATLNQRAYESSAFKKFIINFGKMLNVKLAQANWNINNVSEIGILQGKRPVFNGRHNKFHGLQILINDTEETIIELNDFEINATTHKWKAKITVTIKDHFGLDKNDVLNYQYQHKWFAAWWLLQHTRNYIPFETELTIGMDLIADPDNAPQP